MRILAIDSGSSRIGIAISDPMGRIAAPLMILPHTSRTRDAQKIAQIAKEMNVGLIIVGQCIGDDGLPTLEGRRASRLMISIKEFIPVPTLLWDEAFTTQDARRIRIDMGASRRKRHGHLDDLAAAVLLQSYLDGQSRDNSSQV